ncbi:small, acid-soluble spore protein, alpha/beta type [Clostridium sp. WILCCON 0269]|uniref:Small, acid-soluble spore protein, alpha/beta type n=1 Tax=Candidatus Clostridium eludens TaxID=3381663 RepID=A0ABW8SKL4_9CLOT
MARNNSNLVVTGKVAKFKREPDEEIGIGSKKIYNGDLIARKAGTVGGNKTAKAYEEDLR